MLFQHLTYALRFARRQPAVTVIAVLSLAIGLAATAASASLLDAFGLRPLAVADPDSLVQITTSQDQAPFGSVSYPDFEDVGVRARTLARVAAYRVRGAGLSGPEAPPVVVLMNLVSPEYFATLGVNAAVGRTFIASDAASSAGPTVVVSDHLWRRRFGAATDITQRTVVLNGTSCQVLGVLPSSFTGLDSHLSPDIWMLYPAWASVMSGGRPAAPSRAAREFRIVARLDSSLSARDRFLQTFGVTPPALTRAQAELDVIVGALAASYPDTNAGQRALVQTQNKASRRVVAILAVLLWILVGLVLLVGCANVAGLLLGRAEGRRQEMAIRVALGASRRQLVAQMLVESLMLAAMAGVAGLVLAIWIVRSLPSLLPPMSIPLGFEFRLDLRVLLVTFAVTGATAVVFGLGPALAGSRVGIAYAARGDAAASRVRWWSARDLLVVAQIGVSFVLLVCGALLVQSLGRAQAIDPGFQVRPLLLATLAPPAAGYDNARSLAFFADLADRLRGAPGVTRVSMARRIPLAPDGGGAVREIEPPDRSTPAGGSPLNIHFNSVSPNYFSVMGSRIARGRSFNDRDVAAAGRVVVINETMAARYWPDGTALGRVLGVKGPDAGPYEIVGIVADGKYNRLAETAFPYMFFALPQVPSSELTFIVEAGPDPAAAASLVRDAVRQIDPRMPTMQMLTLTDHMRYAFYEPHLTSVIVGTLSIAGLVLSLIGLYGVIAFVVARRTKEIGVQMALGARPAQILRAVWRRALALAVAGVAAGTAVGLAATNVLAGSLYGLSASDPATFVLTAVALLVVAMAASWWPARRAMRIDPVQALAHE